VVLKYLVTILLSLKLAGCGIGQRFLADLREKANRFRVDKQYYAEANTREEVLKVAKSYYGPDHINVAVASSELAQSYMAQGRYSKAELSCRQALEIFKLNKAEAHPDAEGIRTLLAGSYRLQGKFSQAISILLETLQTVERIYGSNHRRLVVLNINVAWLYRDQGNHAKADTFFQRALAILELRGRRESPQLEKAIELEVVNVMNIYRKIGNKVIEKKV